MTPDPERSSNIKIGPYATQEASPTERVGYQYFADQKSGSYLGWPAVQWRHGAHVFFFFCSRPMCYFSLRACQFCVCVCATGFFGAFGGVVFCFLLWGGCVCVSFSANKQMPSLSFGVGDIPLLTSITSYMCVSPQFLCRVPFPNQQTMPSLSGFPSCSQANAPIHFPRASMLQFVSANNLEA